MKRLFITLLMLLFVTPMFALVAATQDADVNFSELFLNGTTFAAATVFVIDFLKNLWPVLFQGKFLTYFSWLSPIALAFIAYAFGWGYFAEYTQWWMVLLAGVYTSVAAYFGQYLGLLNIILQAFNINLPGYRAKKRLAAKTKS